MRLFICPRRLGRFVSLLLENIHPRILMFIFVPLVIFFAVAAVDDTDGYFLSDLFCPKACHLMEHSYEEL